MRLCLCAEPTGAGAAIVHYSRNEYDKLMQNTDKYQSEELVVDMGGGTTDFTRYKITGIRIDDEVIWRYENLHITGCPYLGGTDITQAIIDYYEEQVNTKLSRPIEELKSPHREEAYNNLRQRAESTKIALTNSSTVQRNVFISQQNIVLKLNREKLSEITEPLLLSFKNQLSKVLGDQPIQKISLIGGSSKLHPVIKAIKAIVPNTTMNHINNNRTIVAEGALIVGMIKEQRIKGLNVYFTSPHAIGIGIVNNVLENLIPVKRCLPFQYTYPDHWNASKTKSISALVYEGNNKKASKNRLLGEVRLQLSKEYDAGEASLVLHAAMNEDCMINIECYEQDRPENKGVFCTDIEKIRKASLQKQKKQKKKSKTKNSNHKNNKNYPKLKYNSSKSSSPSKTNLSIISKLKSECDDYLKKLYQNINNDETIQQQYSNYLQKFDNNSYNEDQWRQFIQDIKTTMNISTSRKRVFNQISSTLDETIESTENAKQYEKNPLKKQKFDF